MRLIELAFSEDKIKRDTRGRFAPKGASASQGDYEQGLWRKMNRKEFGSRVMADMRTKGWEVSGWDKHGAQVVARKKTSLGQVRLETNPSFGTVATLKRGGRTSNISYRNRIPTVEQVTVDFGAGHGQDWG